MTSTIPSAPGLPASISALFDKARAVAKNITDLATDRDRAEVSLSVARDNFDSEPSRKSLDALAKSRAELETEGQTFEAIAGFLNSQP